MAFQDKKNAYNYVNEYTRKNYDRIQVIRKRGEKEKLTAIAAARGLSLSAFVNMCIDEKLKRSGIEI